MINKNEYFKFLESALYKHDNDGISWLELAKEFNRLFNDNLSQSSIRHRCERYFDSPNKEKYVPKCKGWNVHEFKKLEPSNDGEETMEYHSDGTVSAQKVVEFNESLLNDRNKLLKSFGYDPSKWNIDAISLKKWNQQIKGTDEIKTLCSVGLKLKPKKAISNDDIVDSLKELMKKEITPYKFDYEEYDESLDDNKLFEFCPIELHMGKLSNDDETGENYDLKICKRIFEDIVERSCKIQYEKKCGKALVIIGSDFFNSESDNCTSNNKIPQQNDTRYKKLFMTGLELYIKALKTFRLLFNEVEVRLCSGNHARAMEFFLYVALQQYFKEDCVVKFIEDYKDTQAIKFGNCAIFYNHGEVDIKRVIKSIPAEFYDIWGQTIYRELHLGHLHKEVTVDDESGMITRRIGSPCATDAWHYQNRFVGATKKHQLFIWDKNDGLCEIEYINIKIKEYDK